MTPSLDRRRDRADRGDREDWTEKTAPDKCESSPAGGHGEDVPVRYLEGGWHNDYSPRYRKPYDIYKKAASHIRDIKRNKEK